MHENKPTPFFLEKGTIWNNFMVSRVDVKFHLKILNDFVFNFRRFEFHPDSEICDRTWIPLFRDKFSFIHLLLKKINYLNHPARFYMKVVGFLRKENFLALAPVTISFKVMLCLRTKCLLASRVVFSANLFNINA